MCVMGECSEDCLIKINNNFLYHIPNNLLLKRSLIFYNEKYQFFLMHRQDVVEGCLVLQTLTQHDKQWAYFWPPQ